MFPLLAAFDMRPVPSITISELVVKEPSSNPVGTSVTCWSCKLPIIAGVLIPTSGYGLHGLVFGLFLDITPIEWRLTLAIGFQMALVGR